MNKTDIAIPSWIDHELQNWARWSLSDEWPWCAGWPGPKSARDPVSRLYRAPDWGNTPRLLPPNEANAQIVQKAYDAMFQTERQTVNAEYLRPRDSGRWSYGRTGAARRLRMSLNSYETFLRCACLKVEQAFRR